MSFLVNAGIIQQKPVPLAFGPSLWLDADDPAGTGVQPSNGSSIASWVDKSGNRNNFTQAGAPKPTYATNTLNGKPTIAFLAQYLDGTTVSTTQYTCFVVGKTTSTVSTQVQYSNGAGGSNGQSMCAITQPSKKHGLLYGGATWCEVTPAPDTNYHTFCATWNGTNTIYYIGNASQTISNNTTAPTAPSGTSRIGADAIAANTLGGNIAEIIFYARALTSTQITSIYNYLNAKWGV